MCFLLKLLYFSFFDGTLKFFEYRTLVGWSGLLEP